MFYAIALVLFILSFFASERAEALRVASKTLNRSHFLAPGNLGVAQASTRYDLQAKAYDMLVGPLAVGSIVTSVVGIWSTFS